MKTPTKKEPEMFESEVQAGITVLTAKGLDWQSAARSPFLDMARADACVLGLTVGGYWEAKSQWDVTEEWMQAHGFLITDETLDAADLNYCDACQELADTWRNAAELVTP